MKWTLGEIKPDVGADVRWKDYEFAQNHVDVDNYEERFRAIISRRSTG